MNKSSLQHKEPACGLACCLRCFLTATAEWSRCSRGNIAAQAKDTYLLSGSLWKKLAGLYPGIQTPVLKGQLTCILCTSMSSSEE